MLQFKKLNKKKMKLEEAIIYINENTPQKKKEEKTVDLKDECDKPIGRIYTVIDRQGIINEFTLIIEDDVPYLTHEFKNPNTELLLDDEEDII